MIGAVCIDELHKSLHWKMRPKMQQVPAVLRNKAPNAVFLYMSGTLTDKDMAEAKKMCCMSDSLVTIAASPVLQQHFFINVQRPSSCKSWRGVDTPGKEEPGLKHLMSVLLTPWKDDIKLEEATAKVMMVFCKVRVVNTAQNKTAQYCTALIKTSSVVLTVQPGIQKVGHGGM